MSMKDIFVTSIGTDKWRSMSCTDQAYRLSSIFVSPKNRISTILGPRSFRRTSSCISYSIVFTFIMVCRIYQIISIPFFNSEGPSAIVPCFFSQGSVALIHLVNVSFFILVKSSFISATQITFPPVNRT